MKAAIGGISAALMLTALAGGQEVGAGGRRPVVRPGAGTAGAGVGARGVVGLGGRGVVPLDPVTGPLRETQAGALDVSGAWTGVFCENDTVLLADLTLSNADAGQRRLTGELHFVVVPPPLVQGRLAPPATGEGRWKVAGVVDPGSGVVFLEEQGALTKVAGVRPVSLRGVYASGRKELAGQEWTSGEYALTSPYFVLARGAEVKAIKTLAEHAVASLAQVAAGAGNPPSDEEIAKWASRYETEYPGSAQQDSLNKVVVQALPLLADEAFKPVFGATYDTIDYGQLAVSLRRVGGAAPAAPRGRPVPPSPEEQAARLQAMQDLMAQARSAQEAGDQAAPQKLMQQATAAVTGGQAGARGGLARADPAFVRKYMHVPYILRPSPQRIVATAAMRTIDAWGAEELAHFSKDAPVGSAFDDLAAVEATLLERANYAWPSAKKGWEESFDKLRAAMGPAALAANVKWRASAEGMEGAHLLASWQVDNATLLKFAPAADVAAAEQRINGRLDALLEQLLAVPRQQMAAFGTGASAIGNGVMWYPGVVAAFGFAESRPAVQKLLADFHAERERDLALGKADFLKAIAGAKSLEWLQSLTLTNFTVPGDQQMKAFAPIAEAMAKRKMELDEAKMMSMFSQGEQKIMDKPGHIDVAKGKGMKPSEEDIQLAVLRGYAALNGEMLDAHTARLQTRMGSPGGIPFSMVVKVSDVKAVKIEPGEKAGWYDCTFRCLMEASIPRDNVFAAIDPHAREGLDQGAAMANAAMKAFQDEDRKITIMLNPNGWRIIGADEAGAIEVGLDQLMKMQMKR